MNEKKEEKKIESWHCCEKCGDKMYPNAKKDWRGITVMDGKWKKTVVILNTELTLRASPPLHIGRIKSKLEMTRERGLWYH